MCESCACNGCEKFSCCYGDCGCGCDSCSKKCCGCAVCTTCSLCALFLLYFIISLIVVYASQDNKDSEEDSDICQSIEFKPRYIKCNNNNVLYIDLSLEERDRGNNYFHSYKTAIDDLLR